MPIYLLKVWGYVSQHAKLRNNPAEMFELANEPVTIWRYLNLIHFIPTYHTLYFL